MLGKRKRCGLVVNAPAPTTSRASDVFTLPKSISSPLATALLQAPALASDGDSHTLSATKLASPSATWRERRPLTEANLCRLNMLNSNVSKARPKRRTPSPTKATPNAAHDLDKLRAFGILDIDRQLDSLPPDLRRVVGAIGKRSADTAPPSARKDRILDVADAAAQKKEADGIDALGRQLYLQPCMWHGDDELIDVARDHNLVRGFLPPAPNATVDLLGEIENPRPDLCFGYIRHDIVRRLRRVHHKPAPFPDTDELVYRTKKLEVSCDVILPFLTVQFKSSIKGKSLREAEIQCLRDSAAIVRANHELLCLAGRDDGEPSVAQFACHFSSSCDLERARLYLHYREQPPGSTSSSPHVYITKRILECDLGDEESVARWRTHMRGIYDFAVGPRLKFYQEGLVQLAETAGRGPGLEETATLARSSDSASISALTSSRRSDYSTEVRDQRTGFATLRQPSLRPNNEFFTPPRSESDHGDAGVDQGSRKRARVDQDDEVPI